MMYILGYLRKHFLQYKYTAVQKFGISKGFFFYLFFFFLKKCLMLIKAVAYLFDKKIILWNIIAI